MTDIELDDCSADETAIDFGYSPKRVLRCLLKLQQEVEDLKTQLGSQDEQTSEVITLKMMKDMQSRLNASEEANARLKQYAENTYLGLTAFVTVSELQAIHGAGSHAALPENCLTTVQRTALAGLTEKKEV